jgi:hypothetical protein
MQNIQKEIDANIKKVLLSGHKSWEANVKQLKQTGGVSRTKPPSASATRDAIWLALMALGIGPATKSSRTRILFRHGRSDLIAGAMTVFVDCDPKPSALTRPKSGAIPQTKAIVPSTSWPMPTWQQSRNADKHCQAHRG